MVSIAAFMRQRPLLAAIWLIAALAAAVQVARLTVLVDAERASASVMPGWTFFLQHACLSSFTEAARLAAEGNRNVYDPRLYTAPGCGDDLLKCSERPIGPFLVDIYQYPPAFLLLPALARTLTDDFFLVRTGWFVVQVGLFAAATLLLARCVGGTAGAIAAMLLPGRRRDVRAGVRWHLDDRAAAVGGRRDAGEPGARAGAERVGAGSRDRAYERRPRRARAHRGLDHVRCRRSG